MKKEENLKENSNSSGVVSVTLGILSLLFALGINFHGFILGIIAIIFGISQHKKAKNKWSKAGIILGALGIIINVSLFIWFIAIVSQQLQNSGVLEKIAQLQGLQNAYTNPQ